MILTCFLYLGLPSYNSLGALPPLAVHQVRLVEFVLEKPVHVRYPLRLGGHLTTNDEPLDIPPLVGTRLSSGLEEGLDIIDIVKYLEPDPAEAPIVGELLDLVAGICHKFGQIEIDSV